MTDTLSQPVEYDYCERDSSDLSDVKQFTFRILHDYLQPSSLTSPTEAALHFDSGFPWDHPDGRGKCHVRAVMEDVWELLFILIQQIPHDHPSQEKLVQFIIALRNLPVYIPVSMGDSIIYLWKTLPMFEYGMRTCLHRIPTAHIATGENTRQRWYNFNAFAARLVRDGMAVQCGLSICMGRLCGALENEPDRRSKAFRQFPSKLDVKVPIAARWIILCTQRIYSASVDNYCDGWRYEHLFGNRFRGTPGYSVARWDFWKVKDETRSIAKRALKAMCMAEQSAFNDPISVRWSLPSVSLAPSLCPPTFDQKFVQTVDSPVRSDV
ncbi:hypothetical protein J3A83DRAFT_4190405 [Scleroderma citrinum]